MKKEESIFKKALQKRESMSHPAREDFVEYLKTVPLDEHGNSIVVDKITELIASVMDYCHKKGKNSSIIIAPGIGKSTLARHFMLYQIGQKPSLRTTVIMGTDNDASQAVALCRDIVTGKRFREVYPEIEYDFDFERSHKARSKTGDIQMQRGFSMDKWYLRTDGQRKDPTMEACPVELKGESRRCDLALFDDIVGEMVADSAQRSFKVEKAFWNTWVDGRLSNGGQFIYLQNLRNAQDLAHKLRLDKRVCSLWIGVNDDVDRLFVRVYHPPRYLPLVRNPEDFGCEMTDVTDPSCPPDYEFSMPLPERYTTIQGEKVNIWSKDYLQSRNPSAFRRLYQLKVLSSDSLMFPSFESRQIPGGKPDHIFNIEMLGEVPIIPDNERSRYKISMGLDWSSQKRKGKALTALIQDVNTKRVLPIFHRKIKGDIRSVVNLLRMLYNSGFRWDVLYAESNAIQSELNNAVREMSINEDGTVPDWAYTIVDFMTTSQKWKLENGLPDINIAFETGQLMWPGQMAQNYADWSSMELDFSQMTVDKVIMTPDSIMSFWFAWRGLKDYLGGYSVGESTGTADIIEIGNDVSSWKL